MVINIPATPDDNYVEWVLVAIEASNYCAIALPTTTKLETTLFVKALAGRKNGRGKVVGKGS